VARYVDAIDLPVPIEEAFDFLADFSRTAEWDPGVTEAERLGSGRIGRGSRFRVVISFLGRSLPIEYEITTYERPSRLVLEGGDETFRSIDEITFVARAGGTRVTYEAQIALAGIRRAADPLLDVLFQRVGRLAVRGLRERMTETRGIAAKKPGRAPRAKAATE
jgi:dehydrogenase/reductase SDR family member 12